MAAIRCSDCGSNWPDDWRGRCWMTREDDDGDLVVCGGTLCYMGNATAMPRDEAVRLRARYEFALFLERESPEQANKRRSSWAAAHPEPPRITPAEVRSMRRRLQDL